MQPQPKRISKISLSYLIAALAGMGLIIIALFIARYLRADPVPSPAPGPGTGRLTGKLTDSNGSPISNMIVGLRNGPEAQTDGEGKFVLNNVPMGDQLIVVKPPSGRGQLTQNIHVEDKPTTVNLIYNSNTSKLGLLSITAPVDDGVLDLHPDGPQYRATIYGRCDGLNQVFDTFDVWLLVSSESDSRLWVQHPPAVVDKSNSTWRASALFGSAEHPARNGEHWNIIAIASSADSEIGRIANTPKLSLLPPHVSSNVITVEAKIESK